jgi:hypothetical protein
MKVTGIALRQAAEPGDVTGSGLVVDEARDHEQTALEQRMGHQVEHRAAMACSEPKPVSMTSRPSEETVV